MPVVAIPATVTSNVESTSLRIFRPDWTQYIKPNGVPADIITSNRSLWRMVMNVGLLTYDEARVVEAYISDMEELDTWSRIDLGRGQPSGGESPTIASIDNQTLTLSGPITGMATGMTLEIDARRTVMVRGWDAGTNELTVVPPDVAGYAVGASVYAASHVDMALEFGREGPRKLWSGDGLSGPYVLSFIERSRF